MDAIHLLLLFVQICFAKRKNITIVIDPKELTQTLLTLGDTLVKELNDPVDELGEYLMRDFYQYFNNLDDALDLITENNGTRKAEGESVFSAIAERGGPPHLNMKINYAKLMKKYNWTEEQKEHAEETIKDTKFLWGVVKDHVCPPATEDNLF